MSSREVEFAHLMQDVTYKRAKVELEEAELRRDAARVHLETEKIIQERVKRAADEDDAAMALPNTNFGGLS
jgi:Ser-tRNA(Ala) deacylase AlaX